MKVNPRKRNEGNEPNVKRKNERRKKGERTEAWEEEGGENDKKQENITRKNKGEKEVKHR